MIVEVRATKDDIEKYVKSRIFQLAECVLSNDELQQAVVSGISSTVDGMYVYLIYESQHISILHAIGISSPSFPWRP
jgi:hypothetical protein